MRLIDADLLIERMGFYNTQQEREENAGQIITLEDFDNMPTAYDVNKVVEQLETARDGYSTAQLMTATNDELVKRFIAKEKAMNLAIKIVKAGGKNVNS